MPSAETSIFRISQSSILMFLLRKHAVWAVISTSVIIVVLAALAIALADVRYAILALMVVCIIAPMVLVMLYFYYALKPDVVFNVLPHSLELTPEGIKVTLFECKEKEVEDKNVKEADDGENVSETEEEKEGSKEEPEYVAISERFISYDSLSRYEVGLNDVIYHLGDTGYLFITQTAFASGEDFKDFVLGVSGKWH